MTLLLGKGIVIVGGDKAYATPFWIAIHAIRRSGSDLPIELWFQDKELPDCERKDELEKLGVTVRSFADGPGGRKHEKEGKFPSTDPLHLSPSSPDQDQRQRKSDLLGVLGLRLILI